MTQETKKIQAKYNKACSICSKELVGCAPISKKCAFKTLLFCGIKCYKKHVDLENIKLKNYTSFIGEIPSHVLTINTHQK